MNQSNVRSKVKQFMREYNLVEVTLDKLKEIIHSQGYTIIEFNNIFNDEDIALLIEALNIEYLAEGSKGFTYADQRHRLVFLHEDLSDKEKLLVLAHEEGHIYCGHMSSDSIVGKDVQEEYEANEFAHYIFKPGKWQILLHSLSNNKKLVVSCVLLLVLAIIGITIGICTLREKTYYGEYYLTSTGNKYHKAECIFIKNKTDTHRMTVEEFRSGNYEHCKICLP